MSWLIRDDQDQTAYSSLIGGKARNLFRLKELGVNVPHFAVIPQDALSKQIPGDLWEDRTREDLATLIDSFQIPQDLIDEIRKEFGSGLDEKGLAVRSSGIDEDGKDYSFAGQYETYLYVRPDELMLRIKDVWKSSFSERALKYRSEHGLKVQPGIAVIIQEMIDAEISGVAFGIDPITADPDCKVISSVYGLGEGLVSGELDADTFMIKDGLVESKLVRKTHRLIRDLENSGTKKVNVSDDKIGLSSLEERHIKEIAGLLDRLESEFGGPQDIEFALTNGVLYLLQTRPVTAISRKERGEYIVWDNSNIIESYPGVTTPLTSTATTNSGSVDNKEKELSPAEPIDRIREFGFTSNPSSKISASSQQLEYRIMSNLTFRS